MKKTFLLFTFLIFHFNAYSQLQSAYWYFGQNAGLDFSDVTPEVIYDGQLNTLEGCASISNAEGNLLFYTDGSTVYNREHIVMPNGTGLYGNPSSTQSGIIVPYPGNPDLYYIFTVGANDSASPEIPSDANKGFNYYIVDMTLNGGLGGVLPFDNISNNLLPLTSEKVTAVVHKNNQNFWVITHFENKFYAYLIDPNGINLNPVVSEIGPYIDPQVYPVTSRGYLKTSPNGKFIAVGHLSHLGLADIPQDVVDFYGPYYTNSTFSNGYDGFAGVYDFDNETGSISNERVLSDIGSPYGVEFSYLSNFLYVTYDFHDISDPINVQWLKGEVIQYDMNASDIPSSGTVIFDDFTMNMFGIFSARGALQLALDKKIYYSNSSLGYNHPQSNYLSVIHSPETQGMDANLELDFIQLNTTDNPNHYSTQGLPPFITSFFNASIEFEGDIFNSGICVGKPVTLSVQSNYEALSVVWDFGDGFTSTEFNPTHIYNAPGTYTISATITIIDDVETVTRSIIIHPLPEVQNANLVECDFNEDGLALFNLNEANNSISSQTENLISYHFTQEEAELNENALPNIYANISDPQTIFARVINPQQCASISELILTTSLQDVKTVENLSLCDLNSDNVEIFDLTESQVRIESLYINSVTILSYHANIYDAEMNLNSLNLNHQNTLNLQTIYARVQTEDCTDIVSFKLEMLPLPVISLEDFEICPDGSDIVDAGSGYTSYQWTGLQGADLNQPIDQQSITISNAGTYSLILENEFGCTYEDFFAVSIKELPLISEIDISENGTAVINAIGDGPFEYSLNGILWQNSTMFYNLNPGDYDLYIRDRDGCISLKDGFGILEIPNFISPNGDGYNDTWTIRGISNYADVHIQIFDRNGKLFADRVNHNNSEVWDGKYLGRVVNTGSYWYIIKTKDGRKYVGSIAVRNY